MPNELPEVPEENESFADGIYVENAARKFVDNDATIQYDSWYRLSEFATWPRPVQLRCCAMAALEWRRNAETNDTTMPVWRVYIENARAWDERGFAL